MNPAHIHILLNHITVIAVVLATLLFIFSLVRKKSQFLDISLILVILVALWTVPAYVTGYPAKEIISANPSLSGNIVEDHQNMALLAFILTEVSGLLAAVSIASKKFYRDKFSKLCKITLMVLIISCAFIVCAANFGGRISHPEISAELNLAVSNLAAKTV